MPDQCHQKMAVLTQRFLAEGAAELEAHSECFFLLFLLERFTREDGHEFSLLLFWYRQLKLLGAKKAEVVVLLGLEVRSEQKDQFVILI